MHLRIATWNTWKNEGEYPRRLRAMAGTLRALAPDVVLLQECFRLHPGDDPAADTIEADTCAYLARETGLMSVFAGARTKPRRLAGQWRESDSGHAVLTRWPARDAERLSLKSSERGGERIALCLRLDTPSGPLRLACVHFSHLRDEAALRKHQFEQVMARLAETSTDGEPVIIGGDFNCTRGDDEWENAVVPPGWQRDDALGALGITDPTHPLPGHPERRGRRIDFIVAMRRSSAPAMTLRDGGVCALAAEPGGVLPSDHALVWTDWALPGVR